MNLSEVTILSSCLLQAMCDQYPPSPDVEKVSDVASRTIRDGSKYVECLEKKIRAREQENRIYNTIKWLLEKLPGFMRFFFSLHIQKCDLEIRKNVKEVEKINKKINLTKEIRRNVEWWNQFTEGGDIEQIVEGFVKISDGWNSFYKFDQDLTHATQSFRRRSV